MKEWSDPERVAEYLSREIPHRQTAEAMLLQLSWLRAAGFANVEWLQLTLVVGTAS
jgi:hypothetical protein